MERFLWTVGIFAIGLYMIYSGVIVRLGKSRKQFVGGSFPVLAPREIFVLSIPIGLGVVTIGFMIVFPEWGDLLNYPAGFFFLITVILGFWAPGWVKPDWLRWLDDNYGHVRDEMLQEANKMGAKQWEKETRTQADLEAWADEVARRNGWQRLP
ncbi:MAG: hypothetical protein GY796_34330 [Chloroflexi bacterium]|nr:hypothetical protein [Chloroflexota bacterium]